MLRTAVAPDGGGAQVVAFGNPNTADLAGCGDECGIEPLACRKLGHSRGYHRPKSPAQLCLSSNSSTNPRSAGPSRGRPGAPRWRFVGSIYEWNNHRSKEFPLFGRGCDYTDDTVCTVALADALLSGSEPARHLQDWCRRHPGRGYGGMFAQWIQKPAPLAYDSFGNGAAMRVSAAGWLADDAPAVVVLADKITVITHSHPEGLKGARATAHAILRARQGATARDIRDEIVAAYGYDLTRTVDDIRPVYEFNETCQETVPEALICALTATSFEDAIRNAISIGGDSDTVAAIAGSIAEPLFGIPTDIATRGRSYLPADMLAVLERFVLAAGGTTQH